MVAYHYVYDIRFVFSFISIGIGNVYIDKYTVCMHTQHTYILHVYNIWHFNGMMELCNDGVITVSDEENVNVKKLR